MACIDHGRCGTRQVYNKQQHRRVLEAKLGRALVRGEVAMHTCDNKRCINPEHPEHGTRAIARRLGVSQWTISHALRGETWRNV